MSIWSSTTLVIVAAPTVHRCVATRVSVMPPERRCTAPKRKRRNQEAMGVRPAAVVELEPAAVSERPASEARRNDEANELAEGESARTAEGAPALESDKEIWWAGLDSNQRSGNATGLQPVPFGHSGTDPDLI